MTNGLWDDVKDFYYQKFGIAPELVEIAPILDLLRLCASGSSNKTIAEFFNENEEWLADLFDAYLGFRGWNQDWPFSPLRIYKELEDRSFDNFYDRICRTLDHIPTKVNADNMYESAVMVERLERLFDEKWI